MTKLSERFYTVAYQAHEAHDAMQRAIEEAIELAIKLEEEIERLRADAERYRFLRNQPLYGSEETVPYISAPENNRIYWALTGEIADHLIDAAMKEGNE